MTQPPVSYKRHRFRRFNFDTLWVTRDGDPVTVDLPKDPKRSERPWLPYDEKLLEAIYWTAIEIAVRLNAPQG